MRQRIVAVVAIALCSVLVAGRAEAGDLLLRAKTRASAEAICARYHFTLTAALDKKHVYLVEAPDTVTQATLDAILANDRDVQGLEFSATVQVLAESVTPTLTQSVAPILERSTLSQYDATFLNYYGASTWEPYVTQSAAELIGAVSAHEVATGAGTIAIIDTGVDPFHPALQNALVEGYDFTYDLPGFGSEWSDLLGLTQSVAPILESSRLSQSVAPILEHRLAALFPPYFGHGTMVAGIVHLTAPTSKIMPLKAFTADGSATLFNIIRAIYHAADHGARVINMSFVMTQPSKELEEALKYAAQHGVIGVAAIGNDGLWTNTSRIYPASYHVTFGVGSTTTEDDHRSTFSNFGNDVTIGAPGEALLTIYPGGLYATVSGTSFAAGWVSGLVGLLLERDAQLMMEEVSRALRRGATKLERQEGMGYGRIDVYESLVVPLK